RAHADELLEVAAIDHERLEVLLDLRGRRARAAVEQRDLAEELPRTHGLERDALAGVVLEEELDEARAHHVHRAAGIAVREHLRALPYLLDVDARGEARPVGGRQVMEERDLREDVGVGGHGAGATIPPPGPALSATSPSPGTTRRGWRASSGGTPRP